MFRLILITEEFFFAEEAEILNAILSETTLTLHLRKKAAEVAQTAELLSKISPLYYARIVIHQHYENEKRFGLAGIHLPEAERYQFDELKKADHTIISTSIHTLENFDQLRNKFAYTFFSPVFPSITKSGYSPQISLADLSSKMNKTQGREQLVALGGITAENIREVKSIGFGGAAVMGAIWKSGNSLTAAKQFESLANSL